MPSEFPFPTAQTPFGPVPEPTINLPLKLVDGYVGVRFFIDTGADVSVLPESVAPYCRVDLEAARAITVTGIEGEGVRVRLGEIVVRIGGQDVNLPCAFSPVENTPALLGRAGLFDRFSVLFDARGDRIAFEPAGA